MILLGSPHFFHWEPINAVCETLLSLAEFGFRPGFRCWFQPVNVKRQQSLHFPNFPIFARPSNSTLPHFSFSYIDLHLLHPYILHLSQHVKDFWKDSNFFWQKNHLVFSLKDLFQICVMSICSIPPKTCSLLTPFSRLNHLEDEIRDMINNRRQEQKQVRQPIQRKQWLSKLSQLPQERVPSKAVQLCIHFDDIVTIIIAIIILICICAATSTAAENPRWDFYDRGLHHFPILLSISSSSSWSMHPNWGKNSKSSAIMATVPK